MFFVQVNSGELYELAGIGTVLNAQLASRLGRRNSASLTASLLIQRPSSHAVNSPRPFPGPYSAATGRRSIRNISPTTARLDLHPVTPWTLGLPGPRHWTGPSRLESPEDQIRNPRTPPHSALQVLSSLPRRRTVPAPDCTSVEPKMSQVHSWSAVERGNPPPRRKSCAACIKAKRRCTLASPSCLRCTQRLIECCYPDTPAAPKRRAPRSRFVVEKDAFPTPAPVHLDPSPDPLAIPDVPVEYLAIAPDPVVVFEVNTTTTPDFFHPPQDPAAADPNRIYHALPIITSRHDPPPRTPPTTVATRLELNPVLYAITSRLQFSMDKIFASINQMVLECGTPWSHPSIYRNFMPKVLEGTLSPHPAPTTPSNSPPNRRTNNLRPLHRQKPAQRPPHSAHHLLARHRPPVHRPPLHRPPHPRPPPRPPPLPNHPHLRRRPLPAPARLLRRPPAHGRRLRFDALPALRQGDV